MRFIRWTVMVTALIVASAGCSSDASEKDAQKDKLATLAQRPTIEQITATYEDMQDKLRGRLSAEVGPLRWINKENTSGAGCADFPGVGGQRRTLSGWTSEGNLPDAQWERAVAIVAEVTGEYGFEAPKAIVDRPSDHEIRATDSYSGGYLFGTASNTVLMVSTGCHLPADAHPNNTSATPSRS